MQTLLIPESPLERVRVISVRSWDATLKQGAEHEGALRMVDRRSTRGLKALDHALNHVLDTHSLHNGLRVDLAAANAIQILWGLHHDLAREVLG